MCVCVCVCVCVCDGERMNECVYVYTCVSLCICVQIIHVVCDKTKMEEAVHLPTACLTDQNVNHGLGRSEPTTLN